MTKARDLSSIIGSSGQIDNDKITLDAAEIPSLDTAKITTGTFSADRINNASLSNVTQLPFSAGTDWQSTIVTGTTLTAVAGKGYWIDTTSNACTVTLPASASVGDFIEFSDYARTWGTNAVTINQNSLKFQGYTSPNPEYNTNGQSVKIIYSGATQGWIPSVDDDVTDEVPQTVSIDFLVIAGGGGGTYVGGGGAGGYRTSTQSIGFGNTITVTVGDGSTGTNISGGQPSNGSDSSVSGTGLTTITSAGGGAGGAQEGNGANGGSGGGGGYTSGAGGSGNTPSTSPSQGNDGGNGASGAPNYGGGGGGGAGAVGGNGTTTTGGAGGNGASSSITGSSITRAGGGGGAVYDGGTAGAGGSGGGGAAGAGGSNSNGTDGTANTGSGGGGGSYMTSPGGTGGSGGKGVVILRMLATDYSGTTTGSPTVSDDGSYKVLQFNGSGSYTT